MDIPALCRNQNVDRPPQDFGRRIAEDDLGALAEQQDAHVLIDDDDAFGGDVQDAAEDVLQRFREAGLNRQCLAERVPRMPPARAGVLRAVLPASMGVFNFEASWRGRTMRTGRRQSGCPGYKISLVFLAL
ncbi:hypothetical protein D3C80_849750 [compost metagenome]